ncbi:MAG TPA: hypothetical protein VL860_12140, partial [Planctomycetota bacterium]|nr:hypothetical protein [Planctomycetota bacterium]
CRPVLVDWKNDQGEPIQMPPFRMTVGPEVNGDFAFNLVMGEISAPERLSFRMTYDGHGATYLNAGNCRITPADWTRLREMLRRNGGRNSWWLAATGLSPQIQAFVNGTDLSGDFNCTVATFMEGTHLRALEADAAITNLRYRPVHAPDGSLQSLDLSGSLAAHAQYDRLRGSFQIDLGAGNRIAVGFDPPPRTANEAPGLPPAAMLWEGWLERNQVITGLRLAGSYRYRPELARPNQTRPAWLSTIAQPYQNLIADTFTCTQVEGADLRVELEDGAELRLFAGQPDMQRYHGSITVRAPRTGPSAGAWAQANFTLAPSAVPPQPAPIQFDLTVFTDHFPVPGQHEMVYTGKFELNQGAITRAWIDKLLLGRDMNVAFTAFPWLDLNNRKESLVIGDFRVIDGRLTDFSDHPFFVRNGNLHGSVAFQSLEPFSGALTIQEITGSQTGFGEHIVEFGPEHLSGRMEFNLGFATRAALNEGWENQSYHLDPDNLFAVHLQSNNKNSPAWQFHYVLPWYMTRERPGYMKAVHFPARLYPPGLNRPDSPLNLDVQAPADWSMTCWFEPANVGEAAQASASLCALPDGNAATAARVAQALAFTGLPGKRWLVVQRNLSVTNIEIKSSDQFDAEGLALPGVGDTKYYPYPHE